MTGSWRWWSAYALAEFLLFYCYPGSAFILIVLNLLTLGLLAAAPGCAEPRFAQAGRWFCVNALAAMLTLQFMLPLYPQAKLYFDFVSSQGFVSGGQWVRNTVAYMVGGAPWTKSGEPWAGYPEWLARYVENPVLFVAAASLAITLVVVGAFRLLWRSWPSATFVFVMAICPPITFTVAFFKQFLLYENYVIYSLPGVIVCAAAGLTLVASLLTKLSGKQSVGWIFTGCLLLGYFLFTNSFRQWLVENPLQQIRESVIYSRGTLDPAAANKRTSGRPASAFRRIFTMLTWSDSIPPAASLPHCNVQTRKEFPSLSTLACPGPHVITARRCGRYSTTRISSRNLSICADSNRASTGSSLNIRPTVRKRLILADTASTSAS